MCVFQLKCLPYNLYRNIWKFAYFHPIVRWCLTRCISLYVQILCIRYCYVFLHIVVCTVHSHHWFDAIQMFTRQSIKLWKCLLSWFCIYANALFSFHSFVCILLPFRILCMACKNCRHCENSRMCLNLNFVIWMLNKMICIFQNCLHQQTAIRTHLHMLLNL